MATAQPGQATAQIQMLTASVRVLMVGSRQITLSVYRQLDTVVPDAIIPFGRVHDSQDKDADKIYVIGRTKKKSGALVRASYFKTRRAAGRSQGYYGRRPRRQSLDGENFVLLVDEQERRLAEEKALKEATPEYSPAIAQQWQALPLIVLAGLR